MTTLEARLGPLTVAGSIPVLSVDVEEWYHNCWVPEYVDPLRRPSLTEELDWLLPEVLECLARFECTATFFVLGEVARRLPGRVREVARAGHEVACHGDNHFRAGDLSVDQFRADIRRAKACLEDLIGLPVVGYRSPEWSLRQPFNPRLLEVARAGFSYDSSLAPYLGAGRLGNPSGPYTIQWRSGLEIQEFPPFALSRRWGLPAGGWTGRLASDRRFDRAVSRQLEESSTALWVVHPWELLDREIPGDLTGIARLLHDLGRRGFRRKFLRRLAENRWQSILVARSAVAYEKGAHNLEEAAESEETGRKRR